MGDVAAHKASIDAASVEELGSALGVPILSKQPAVIGEALVLPSPPPPTRKENSFSMLGKEVLFVLFVLLLMLFAPALRRRLRSCCGRRPPPPPPPPPVMRRTYSALNHDRAVVPAAVGLKEPSADDGQRVS